MTLYENKYRIESTRLKSWDYSSNGYYFITICTKDKRPFFGKVNSACMELSKIGKFVEDKWKRIEQTSENISLDKWVIMPNHLHGIIIIDNPEESTNGPVETFDCPAANAEDRSASQNLSNIVKTFKSSSTQKIGKQGFTDFAWQSRFYDHIIRSEKSLSVIREYIVNNPANWIEDKYNIE